MRFYVIFRPTEWNCELPEPETTLTANNRNVYPRYASIRWLRACYKLVVSLFFFPSVSLEKMHSAGEAYSSDKTVCQSANLMIVSRQV